MVKLRQKAVKQTMYFSYITIYRIFYKISIFVKIKATKTCIPCHNNKGVGIYSLSNP
jgi:hypothetical protein